MRLTVPDEAAGTRLDRFLASVLGDHSRSHIQRLIKDGHVRVPGGPGFGVTVDERALETYTLLKEVVQ